MRPSYQIYVEEQLIDLDPKTIIALTLQGSDFASGDLITRKASYTNQIKVPASQTNIRIFEFANNPKSGSTFPYQKKSITILANGIRILDGITIIKSFDTYFNLQIYSTPKDLNFRISNLYLSDLDFGDSPITWNAAFIDSKRASTTGWCAPVVNYGQIDTSIGVVAIEIGAYYLPSIAYKDVLTTILTNAGYTISGDFYDNDTVFNNLVVLFSRNQFASTTVKMNEVLSTTMLQSDFLRDFLIRFGAFFRFTNNNVEIITYTTLLNNPANSIDWTNKRVRNKKDIVQFTWGSLSQINNFKYNEPDNTESGFPLSSSVFVKYDTNGFLTINNEVISEQKDIYTSIFERPNWIKLGSLGVNPTIEFTSAPPGILYCASSSIWEALPTSYSFDVEPGDRIALLCAKDAGEPAVKYNGSSRSDYKIARFNTNGLSTASAPISLGWRQNLDIYSPSNAMLDTYYQPIQDLFDLGLITTTHEYNLTDLDINNLDLLTSVFDDGNYYLINKVNSYVSYKTTRVELLKI